MSISRIVGRLFKFIRHHSQCRFNAHWNVKYDSGMLNDVGRGGTCLDCGYRFEEIKWPRPPMPEVKSPKCDSCLSGYDGRNGNGYQPCGCDTTISRIDTIGQNGNTGEHYGEADKKICYECLEDCNYLFDDGRCHKCTRLTVEEVTGGD